MISEVRRTPFECKQPFSEGKRSEDFRLNNGEAQKKYANIGKLKRDGVNNRLKD